MSNPRIELAVTFGFVAAVLFGLFQTSRIDLAFSSELETFSGPRAYPGLILGVMLALIGGVAWGQIRAVLQQPDLGQGDENQRWHLAGALFLALVIFVMLFESLGYILAMIPLLTLVGLLCGAQNLLRAFVVAILLSAVCLLIFRYGLATVLPEGLFGIDAVF